jgi:hypothetical protein
MEENQYIVKILDEDYILELRKLLPDLKVLFYKCDNKSKIIALSKISYGDIDFDSNTHIRLTEKDNQLINEYYREIALLRKELIKKLK